jgi:hypothetical protein
MVRAPGRPPAMRNSGSDTSRRRPATGDVDGQPAPVPTFPSKDFGSAANLFGEAVDVAGRNSR